MLKIPETFQLFGQTIDVVFDDKLHYRTNYLGEARYRDNEIVLQPSVEGFTVKQSDIEQTFLHELTHWILKLLNEDALCDNEKFVDTFSGLLHQALISAKYQE